ncbi:SGNH/GDSL hydrolase family protein [Streptomyces chromofuscus]|uniref:SGNH/GDSL hydrolase family protein n=1 Tax=Streptomyces chromofuscus TaxID=42881 RepID=A0A7M2THY6_STRCW|nr:SGNH/GDSL hydrolase family protein [Streptomyces chromofuscus]QOV46891.1 SGNH/GDSL hydrolase family protein [Streptomyces chromofuscus]GGT14344.1 SGNH hydrolase [Streptomyces chromofuscus]
MTRRHHAGGVGVSPTKLSALLAAIVSLIVAVSVALYAGAASDVGTAQRALPGPRPPYDPAAPASTGTWVGAWSTSPSAAEPGTEAAGLHDRSVRNVVHTSVGGTAARITLSNLYGRLPLTITHATIALAAADDSAAAAPDTMRRLAFNGVPTVVIPPGQQAMSDAVRITVPHDSDVLITTYAPAEPGPVTVHTKVRQISYAARGDHAEDVTGAPYTQRVEAWRYLTALDVLSRESDGTLVAFGDSLTEGHSSTVGANRRWPDVLAKRLREAALADLDVPRYGVVNQGIGGNRVLTGGLGRPADNPSGLDRFGRDVLGRTNVKAVVIDLGVNDILRHPSVTDADQILDGLRTLVGQAHARGIRVIGATLMPFGGHRGHSADREAVRQEINAEIRSGRVFDAVVDFDEALRDPYDPRRFHPDYDSGDHVHPNDRGYDRMAHEFDLTTLKGSAPTRL